MLIQQKIGNINKHLINHKTIDWLALQWFETNKRIQRKKTNSGQEVALKFLQENPSLTQGDILFEDEKTIIAIEVLPCECLVVAPKNMFEMASICYEIGNKHLPLFFENEELLVPSEMPLYQLLTAQGYIVKQEQRKLLQPLKTSVTPHSSGNETLFSKIMKLTTTNE
ncbi:urease accessory protein UreE [Flavobacterium psychrotolerans]|uniref:Urease accessory protein UreE n=1 Tax=Flavobacterium psychrotolerans TaxID=2169410 RepID=A0A2U1JMW5_9FLAO|nr:urease accessory protein UreE [Flavobacterium psychrotolerans]PWA06223.1 urease accessory protein UreE [Flavobacterium psychrotolerans]